MKTYVVFFDGECALCHWFVRDLITSPEGQFFFSPLQSDLAAKVLDQKTRQIDSVILYVVEGAEVSIRSTAIVSILQAIQSPTHKQRLLLLVLRFTPQIIADTTYRIIAAVRRFAGKPPTLCPQVPKHVSDRFLLSELPEQTTPHKVQVEDENEIL